MSRTKVNDRVGVLLCVKEPTKEDKTKEVHLIGYGVYTGDFTTPGGIPNNPRLDLDNGETAWGCGCWWGPEEAVYRKVKALKAEKYKVVLVDPDGKVRPIAKTKKETK